MLCSQSTPLPQKENGKRPAPVGPSPLLLGRLPSLAQMDTAKDTREWPENCGKMQHGPFISARMGPSRAADMGLSRPPELTIGAGVLWHLPGASGLNSPGRGLPRGACLYGRSPRIQHGLKGERRISPCPSGAAASGPSRRPPSKREWRLARWHNRRGARYE
jgi:hypothetical protein